MTRTLASSKASRGWRTGSSICAQQQTSPSYSPKSQRTAGRSPAGKLASLHTAEPGDHDELLGTWAAPRTIYISLSSTHAVVPCALAYLSALPSFALVLGLILIAPGWMRKRKRSTTGSSGEHPSCTSRVTLARLTATLVVSLLVSGAKRGSAM